MHLNSRVKLIKLFLKFNKTDLRSGLAHKEMGIYIYRYTSLLPVCHHDSCYSKLNRETSYSECCVWGGGGGKSLVILCAQGLYIELWSLGT